MVTDAIAKCRGLGISNFAYSQSIKIEPQNMAVKEDSNANSCALF